MMSRRAEPNFVLQGGVWNVPNKSFPYKNLPLEYKYVDVLLRVK